MHENKYKRKIEIVYGYVFNGVAIVVGKVGICGYMAYILSIVLTYNTSDHKGRPEITTVNSVLLQTVSNSTDGTNISRHFFGGEEGTGGF
jgi:hypothetical protein